MANKNFADKLHIPFYKSDEPESPVDKGKAPVAEAPKETAKTEVKQAAA